MTIKLPFHEDFAEAWDRYIKFRKRIGKTFKTDKGINTILNKFMLYSEETAIKMIDQSIDNEWTGIFPLRAENGKTIEPKQVYREEGLKINASLPSNYKAEPFDRKKYKLSVITQLESFYQTGKEILDAGNIMHQKLTKLGILTLSDTLKKQIRDYWEYEFTRRRTRFEDELRGSVESEIKHNELRVFLELTRKEGRNILTEI